MLRVHITCQKKIHGTQEDKQGIYYTSSVFVFQLTSRKLQCLIGRVTARDVCVCGHFNQR